MEMSAFVNRSQEGKEKTKKQEKSIGRSFVRCFVGSFFRLCVGEVFGVRWVFCSFLVKRFARPRRAVACFDALREAIA